MIKLHLGCAKRYLKGYIHIDAEILPDEVYFNKKEGMYMKKNRLILIKNTNFWL